MSTDKINFWPSSRHKGHCKHNMTPWITCNVIHTDTEKTWLWWITKDIHINYCKPIIEGQTDQV